MHRCIPTLSSILPSSPPPSFPESIICLFWLQGNIWHAHLHAHSIGLLLFVSVVRIQWEFTQESCRSSDCSTRVPVQERIKVLKMNHRSLPRPVCSIFLDMYIKNMLIYKLEKVIKAILIINL